MADSSIGIVAADGTTKQVDAHTQTNGDFRQTITVGDYETTTTAKVLNTEPTGAEPALAVRLTGPPAPATASDGLTQGRVQVSSSTVSAAVWPVRATRRAGIIYNESTTDVYLTFAATSATANADLVLPPGHGYELMSNTNFRCTDAVSAIWVTAGTGTLRATEWY